MKGNFLKYDEIQRTIINTVQKSNPNAALKLHDQNDRLFAGFYSKEGAGEFVLKNDPVEIYNIEDDRLKECILDIQSKMLEAYSFGNT